MLGHVPDIFLVPAGERPASDHRGRYRRFRLHEANAPSETGSGIEFERFFPVVVESRELWFQDFVLELDLARLDRVGRGRGLSQAIFEVGDLALEVADLAVEVRRLPVGELA